MQENTHRCIYIHIYMYIYYMVTARRRIGLMMLLSSGSAYLLTESNAARITHISRKYCDVSQSLILFKWLFICIFLRTYQLGQFEAECAHVPLRYTYRPSAAINETEDKGDDDAEDVYDTISWGSLLSLLSSSHIFLVPLLPFHPNWTTFISIVAMDITNTFTFPIHIWHRKR